MQSFQYKAKEGPSKIVEGMIEAETSDQAIQKIIQLGLTPIDVEVVSSGSVSKLSKTQLKNPKRAFSFFKKIKFNEVVVFTRQISDLVDASVSILRSLYIVSEQTKNPYLVGIVLQMHDYVRDGGSFSDALAQHDNVFSSLYVSMVKTGEGGGNLSVALERLATYLEKEQENRGKIKASLAYPSLIMIVGFITMFVLLSFVIPRLSVMFDDLNQDLPLPTLLLVKLSDVFGRIWWMLLGAMACGIAGFRKWLRTYEGRLRFDRFMLRLPFLGDFIKTVEIERFARTLATQVETGVTITDALDSVIIVVGNLQLQNELRDVSKEVSNGQSLRAALGRTNFFPEMAANMISVGEETGRLERGLYKVADTYNRQAEQSTKTIISLLGPIVLVFIVSLVGFVVIAMLLPIFQMNLLIE